jgi:hypothetical protein
VKFSRLSGAALAVAALVAAMVASAAYGISTDTGVSGQPDFKNCISDSGVDGCADVKAMLNPSAMALADDGSRVFVTSPSDDAVAVFVRDLSTGALRQLQDNKGGCTSESGTNGCLPGHGLTAASDVVSVGGNAYIVSGDNALVTLTKDSSSGAWKELANNGDNNIFCISEGAVTGCRGDGRALAGANSITAVGSYVYVGGPGTIAVFHRGTKGALKQLADQAGCINSGGTNGCAAATNAFGTVQDMVVSRDGKSVYAVDGNDVLVFSRSKTTGALTQLASPAVSNVSGLNGVSIDQQGTPTSVYVTGTNNAVGVFARSKSDGTLTQLALADGCVNASGAGGCTAAPKMASIGALTRLVVYKTNRYVYVAGDDGVLVLSRIKSGVHGGALTTLLNAAPTDPANCVTEGGAGGCLSGQGLGGLTDIFSTGGGKHIYVSGTDFDSVVTLHQH